MPTCAGCREGAAAPGLNRTRASAALRLARGMDRAGVSREPVLQKTPHARRRSARAPARDFLRMNRSGVIFVAALNGSALGLGAEFAWAYDLRVMADGDFFIGQPEVLLGIMPGGGGTQRLTRLVGTHQSLVAILEGKPFTPAEALANGAVDEVVPQDEVRRPGDRTRRALRHADQGIGRGDQAVGVLRRLDVADRRPAHRARRVPRTALSKVGQELMLDYMARHRSHRRAAALHPAIPTKQALEAGTRARRSGTDRKRSRQ